MYAPGPRYRNVVEEGIREAAFPAELGITLVERGSSK